MKTHIASEHLRTYLIIVLALLAFLPLSIHFITDYMPRTPTGLFTSPIASVSIISQSGCILFEDNGSNIITDFIFQIGPINPDGNWYSYNGSDGTTQSGYDIGPGSDGITQTFTLKNMGTTTVDVTMASSDFDNSTKNDSNYIDVAQTNGSFQIYLPGAGWRNIPDNDDNDDDKTKETTELCIADDLMINESIKGIDFRLRAPVGLQPGNYTAKIVITSYDSAKINPCSGTGVHIIP